jgi:rRNA-processing protein FCF1
VSLLRQHRDFEEEIKAAIPGEVRIVTLDLIILELERLARKKSSTIGRWANTSLAFLRERNYSVAEHKPGPSDIDASLIAFALTEKTPTAIATLDRELRTALGAFGIPIIRPRARYGLLADTFHL